MTVSRQVDVTNQRRSQGNAWRPKRRRRVGLGRSFALLWSGQTVSLLGDQISLLALPLTAAQSLGASTLVIGLIGGATRAPFLLLGLPAGVWIGRLGLRRSMIAADVLRASAVLSLPVIALTGRLSVGLLLGVALVVGTGTVFFQVAYQSFTPLLVGESGSLHAANTRLTFSEATALLVGPGIGGAVIAAVGAVRALALDGVSYMVSIGTLAAVRGNEPDQTPPPGVRLWRQVGEGLRYAFANPVLRAILLCGVAYNFGSSMYDALIAIFAVRTLHVSPAILGLALALGGAGFSIGSLIASPLNTRYGMGRGLIVSAVPSVAGMFVSASASGPLLIPALAVGTLLIGIGQGSFAVNALTIRQAATSDRVRPRATAVHRFATWGVLPIGAICAGVIGEVFGVRAAMVLAGFVASTCFLPLLRSPLRDASTGHRE